MELNQINQRIAVVNAESKRLNSERQQLIGRRQAMEKQLTDLLAAYKKEYGVELTPETIEAEVARVSALKEAEVAGIEAMLGLIREGRFAEAEQMATQSTQAGVTEVEPVQEVAPQAETTTEAEEPAPAVDEQAQVEATVPPVQYPVPPTQAAQPPVQPPVQTAQPPVQATQEPAPVAQPPVVQAPPAPAAAPAPAAPAAPTEEPPMFQPQLPVADVPAPPPNFAPKPQAAPAPQSTGDAPAPPPQFKPKAPLGTPKLGVPPQVGAGTAQPGGMSFQAILSGQAFNPQQGG